MGGGDRVVPEKWLLTDGTKALELRTPPPHTHTQKMATSGRGAVSVSLPSRTPHSHGSHSAQGGDSCSPQQMFSREAGELTPKPDPHDSPRRPKRPAEPAV